MTTGEKKTTSCPFSARRVLFAPIATFYRILRNIFPHRMFPPSPLFARGVSLWPKKHVLLLFREIMAFASDITRTHFAGSLPRLQHHHGLGPGITNRGEGSCRPVRMRRGHQVEPRHGETVERVRERRTKKILKIHLANAFLPTGCPTRACYYSRDGRASCEGLLLEPNLTDRLVIFSNCFPPSECFPPKKTCLGRGGNIPKYTVGFCSCSTQLRTFSTCP